MKTEETVRPGNFYAGFDEEQTVVEKYDRQGVGGKCSKLGKVQQDLFAFFSGTLCLRDKDEPFLWVQGGYLSQGFYYLLIKGGVEQWVRVTFLLLLFLKLPQPKIFNTPRCHIWGQHVLNPNISSLLKINVFSSRGRGLIYIYG